MALYAKIPADSSLIPVTVRFSATYNAQTPFRYDFTREGLPGAKTNQNVFINKLDRHYVYMLERLNFSFSIVKELYTEAIAINPVPLFFINIKKQLSAIVYDHPWPINTFIENNEHVVYFNTNQDSDLQGTFTGMLSQPGPLIPVPIIYGVMTANLYEIQDKDWISHYEKGPSKFIGQDLNR